MSTLAPGRQLDRYTVEAVLGSGGHATVYRVRHLDLGVVRALKLLRDADENLQSRLLAEGRILAGLAHPNLVSVYDVVRVDGAPGLVMEFVGGGTLADLIATGPIPLDEVDRLFRAVCAGVAAAHDAGVVHRDLKPANVLLDDSSRPPRAKVADFGIARTGAPGNAHHTGAGKAMGSPAYMAPEQARDAAACDARADLWSLGACLYALLAGVPPFRGGEWWEILAASSVGKYAPVAEVRADAPAAMVAVIDACLQVRRSDRPANVAALLALLDGQPAGEGMGTWSESALPEPPASTPAAPRRLPLAAVALVAGPLFAITDAGSLVDGALHYPLLRAAGRAVAVEDVVVVELPAVDDPRKLRADYPELLDRLCVAGATAALLDVTLTGETEHDAALATAIADVAGRGMPVIVPVRVDGDAISPPGNLALARVLWLGHAQSLRDLAVGWVRRGRLRAGEHWHVAVLAAQAAVEASAPRVEGGTLVVGPLRNPVSRGSFALAPAGEVPRIAASDVSAATGKVAVLGLLRESADLHATPDGTRHGAEILAVEVQTLLRQAAPRDLPVEVDAIVALGASLAAWRRRWWAALGAVVTLAVLLAMGGWLLSVAAAAVGVGTVWLAVRSRAGPRP